MDIKAKRKNPAYDMQNPISKPVVIADDEALDYARQQLARIEASDHPQDVKDAAIANLRRVYPQL